MPDIHSDQFQTTFKYFGEWNDVPMLSSLFWYHPKTLQYLHERFGSEPRSAFFTIQRKQYLYVDTNWIEALKSSVNAQSAKDIIKTFEGFLPVFQEIRARLLGYLQESRSPSDFSTEEIISRYETIIDAVHTMAAYDVYCMMGEPAFLDPFDAWLTSHLEVVGRPLDFNEQRALLTSPTQSTSTQREEQSFLSLVQKRRDGILTGSDLEQAIAAHVMEYGWIPVYLSGKSWDAEYISAQIEARKDDPEVDTRVRILETYAQQIQSRIAFALQELGDPSSPWPVCMQQIGFVRNESEIIPSLATFILRPFYEEMITRLQITEEYFFSLTPEEVVLSLKGNFVAPSVIANRLRAACNIATRQGLETLDGETARTLFTNVYTPPKTSQEEYTLKGQCASPGEAEGIVRIVQSVEDEERFFKGDILVSESTCIDYVPLMRLAGAVITELGGITSHAAIVSRELGIPCLVGVKGATRLLKDGEKIRVKGSQGRIERIAT